MSEDHTDQQSDSADQAAWASARKASNVFEEWTQSAKNALAERLVLTANHLLRGHPAAPLRLAPHAGKRMRVEVSGMRWPRVSPLVWQITPAGLVEAADPDAATDLRVQLPAGDPLASLAAWARGEQPSVHIEGDSNLATDVNWVIANVRWDAPGDLERLLTPVFGPTVSGGVADGADKAGQLVMSGVRTLAGWISSVSGAGKPSDPP